MQSTLLNGKIAIIDHYAFDQCTKLSKLMHIQRMLQVFISAYTFYIYNQCFSLHSHIHIQHLHAGCKIDTVDQDKDCVNQVVH